MDREIAVGKEAKFRMSVKDRKLRIELNQDGKDGSAGMYVETTPDQFVAMLGSLIPGDSGIEKGVLSAVRMGLEYAMETTDPSKLAALMEQAKGGALNAGQSVDQAQA